MTILHSTLETGVHLIKLNGPLVDTLARELTQTFSEAYDQGAKCIVVDLEDVPFIDSKGLAVLVAALKIVGSNAASFRLAALQTQPKLVFELTGFDEVFPIFDNVTEAVQI